MPKDIIKVDGMSCGHCVQTIENAMKSISSIKQVEVSLENKEVMLDYEGGEEVLSAAKSSISEAGFEVAG